jgi:hypothetical protein
MLASEAGRGAALAGRRRMGAAGAVPGTSEAAGSVEAGRGLLLTGGRTTAAEGADAEAPGGVETAMPENGASPLPEGPEGAEGSVCQRAGRLPKAFKALANLSAPSAVFVSKCSFGHCGRAEQILSEAGSCWKQIGSLLACCEGGGALSPFPGPLPGVSEVFDLPPPFGPSERGRGFLPLS